MANRSVILVLSLVFFAVTFLPAGSVLAEKAMSKGYINSEGNWVESIEQKQRRMAWMNEAKFGMLIHWGLYSVAGGEYNGRTLKKNCEWIQRDYRIPTDEYKQFGKEFNPSNFDAEKWVKLAKESGMRYMIFVAKHFDGFAMYDSEVNDYDVVDATSFGRDPARELAEACRKHDIKFGVCYSLLRDWHEPDAIGIIWEYPEGLTENKVSSQERGRIGIENYIRRKAIPQIEELLTSYRPDVLFYLNSHEMTRQQADVFINLVRKNQPDCIVNKIFWRGAKDVGVGDIDNDLAKISSYEVKMPEEWLFTHKTNYSWGYSKQDNNWSTVESLITKLVDIVSKGGDFILNIGPDAQGVIPEELSQRLIQVGKWLEVNGESIYGAGSSPFGEFNWGRCTTKPGKLYFHIMTSPENEQIEISGLNNKVKRVYQLANGQDLNFNRRADGIVAIDIPGSKMEIYDTVVAAEIEGQLDVDFFPLKLVKQDIDGSINCVATKVTINVDGDGIQAIVKPNEESIGNWRDTRCYLTWSFLIRETGKFNVELTYSCRANENKNKCTIEVAGETLTTDTPTTVQWNNYKTINLGQVSIDEAGEHVMTLRHVWTGKIAPVNVKGIKLVPIKKEGRCE